MRKIMGSDYETPYGVFGDSSGAEKRNHEVLSRA